MENSAGSKQLITEGGWIALGQGLAAAGMLLGIRALTELAPPQVYGAVTLVLGISALGLGTLYGPVMQAVLRYFTQYSREELSNFRYVVMRILFRRTVWSAAILGVTWPLAHYVWGISWTLVVWVLPLVICDGLRTLETVLLNAARKTAKHALLSAGEAWAKPIGAISALLILGPRAESILAGYTIATGAVLYVYYRWGNPDAMLKWRIAMREDPKIRSSIEKYARPLLPSSAIGWLNGVGDRYLIGLMIGVEQVGIYSAIYGLISRPFLMSANIVELTIRPSYYSCVEKANRLASRKLLWKWFGITASIATIGFLATYFAKDVFIGLLLAQEYWVAVDLMPWIAWGYGLLVLAQVFEKVCFAYSRTGTVLFIQSLGGAVGLLAAYIGIKQQGLIGAAMAVPVYFGFQLIITLGAAYIVERNAHGRNVHTQKMMALNTEAKP